MRRLVSRQQPSARSRSTRTLSYTDSSPGNSKFHARAGRGLGGSIPGVLHDASGVVHDVGHVIGHALSGKLSKVPGDVAETGTDVAKAGADAGKGAAKAVNGLVDHLRTVVRPPGMAGSGHGSGSGDPNHGSGSDGRTQTGQDPQPTVLPGAGGGADQHSSPPVSSQAPSSAGTPTFSTLYSSAYSTPIPSSPTLSNGPDKGVSDALPTHTYRPSSSDFIHVLLPSGGSAEDGQTVDGVAPGPLSTASATHSSTTMDALPSRGSGGSGAHRKGFPLAASAAIGSTLGFLVVSALIWAVWLYLRKRRRAFHAVYLPPKRMLSVTSARTVSTVPLFIGASEAGVKDENPFRYPRDTEEDDPFDAASLWCSSTTRSASTLSV